VGLCCRSGKAFGLQSQRDLGKTSEPNTQLCVDQSKREILKISAKLTSSAMGGFSNLYNKVTQAPDIQLRARLP